MAKYTILSEGCRGHLGKQAISLFKLDEDKDPQHYGIGFKEVWDLDPSVHEEGLVVHTMGWPAAAKNVCLDRTFIMEKIIKHFWVI